MTEDLKKAEQNAWDSREYAEIHFGIESAEFELADLTWRHANARCLREGRPKLRIKPKEASKG